MELLLPVALKLFPNMLPSTFEDKFAAVGCLVHLAVFEPTVIVGRKATQAVESSARNG